MPVRSTMIDDEVVGPLYRRTRSQQASNSIESSVNFTILFVGPVNTDTQFTLSA